MNNGQLLIWDYLVQNALGRPNAIRIATIANNLDFPPVGTNNDDVRGWIKDMVMQHNKQIGTSSNGVFIILNDTEREDAAQFVERENRADVVRTNGNYNPQ